MDDTLPPMPPVVEFKNRRTGLLVFGILEILLGGLCALLVPLAVLGQAMSANMTGEVPNYRMAVPGVLMYGLLAVTFIWLGIGSIRCRRWARALLLILSWSWLVTGVIAIGFLLFLSPMMMEEIPPGGPRILVLIIVAVMWSATFMILPGVLVLFYQSRHVKATCETRDPIVRWTDGCPLPVLAVSVWLVFGGVMMVAMPLTYNSVVPCFGVLLSGLPGTLLYLVIGLLWLCLARAWYRLQPGALWITLSVLVLFAISNVVTFTRVDLMDMYRLMGYSPEHIALIERYNLLTSTTMTWWTTGFMLPLIGFLVWMKRFFHRAG